MRMKIWKNHLHLMFTKIEITLIRLWTCILSRYVLNSYNVAIGKMPTNGVMCLKY